MVAGEVATTEVVERSCVERSVASGGIRLDSGWKNRERLL